MPNNEVEKKDIVSEFFDNPETTESTAKPKKRVRARKGIRKEALNIKALKNEGADVLYIEKSKNKSYSKLSVPEKDESGKTKSEVKKENNREIRKTDHSIPKGSAYKQGTFVNEAEPEDSVDE